MKNSVYLRYKYFDNDRSTRGERGCYKNVIVSVVAEQGLWLDYVRKKGK